jgi:four helix bundle protein
VNYQNTRIYRRALELVRCTAEMNAGLPKGYAFLADQGRRASSSVVLNFAEGCGKSGRAETRRFLSIARGSAYEVAAVFDVALVLSASCEMP